MFLDMEIHDIAFADEIVEMCEKVKIRNGEDLQKFYFKVCKKCKDYYKSKINLQSTGKEVAVILDRTFNLWNSAVRMCKESNDGKVKLLGDLLAKYPFKDQLLNNPEIKEMYERFKLFQ